MASLPFAELSEAELLEEYMDTDAEDSSRESVRKPAVIEMSEPELVSAAQVNGTAQPSNSSVQHPPSMSTTAANDQPGSCSRRLPCRLCRRNHPIRFCPNFKALSHARRLRMVVLYKYCSRCLSANHDRQSCLSTRRCPRCNEDHHLLLHDDGTVRSLRQAHAVQRQPRRELQERVRRQSVPMMVTAPVASLSLVRIVALTPTAVVRLQLTTGNIYVRAMLDPCSATGHYICSTLVQQIRLTVNRVNEDRFCELTVHSMYSEEKVSFTARVANLSSLRAPLEDIPVDVGDSFEGLPKADPDFYRSRPIALVIGPERLRQIERTPRIESPNGLVARFTIFGWVLSGAYYR